MIRLLHEQKHNSQLLIIVCSGTKNNNYVHRMEVYKVSGSFNQQQYPWQCLVGVPSIKRSLR